MARIIQKSTNSSRHPVILYDGPCGLCNRFINLVINHDPRAHFRFAALQSPLAHELLQRHCLTDPIPDSIVLIEGEKAYFRSAAVARIARKLTGPIKSLAWLLIVSPPVWDWVYDRLARERQRISRRISQCATPTPEKLKLFLDHN